MSISSRMDRLRRRAELLKRLRQFFDERGFVEVETPLMDAEIIPELHIEPFGVCAIDPASAGQSAGSQSEPCRAPALWLQASPELHMKRLLAEGFGAIYQITRSFRRGHRGRLHNPEFTIVEWSRAGDGMAEGVELLDALCRWAAAAPAATLTSYGEAFAQYAGIDPHHADYAQLAEAARRLGVRAPEGLSAASRDEWLNLLLASVVEPQLGASGPEIIYHYPATQSALAATTVDAKGNEVAERFELYWHGIELANGYHELTDAAALRRRFVEVNRQRAADGRPALPLPETLLTAMESPGLPRSAGCALGFDRLAMLVLGADAIEDAMTFVEGD
ncbi:MAG: EF-P lysine aminoacylase GenX [Pirellulales bacterium]|nr:EF-P lysine aminoacylase GenX [Pirellulales bacterium]